MIKYSKAMKEITLFCKRETERWFVGTGVLFEEPNPTGSRPSDLIVTLIGLYKTTETPEGTKRRRPSGGGRERKKDPNGAKVSQRNP